MKFLNLFRTGHAMTGLVRATIPGAVIVALLMPASAPLARELPPVMEDIRAPEQLARDLEQSSGQIVLLHFWATWCLPCRDEMTALADFWRQKYPELAERGLRVLTVSNDVRDQDLERFAAEFELAFPLYYDPYSKLTSRYGVRGLPSTVVLDGEGRIVEQILGSQDWLAADFGRRIEALLGNPRGERELDLSIKYNPRR